MICAWYVNQCLFYEVTYVLTKDKITQKTQMKVLKYEK